MPNTLTQDQIQQYDRDGYVCPISVLSTDEATEFEQAILNHVSRFQGRLAEPYKHKIHLITKWADRLVHHPAIVNAVEDLLGPNVLCWTTNLLLKKANHPNYVSWHQDSGYWGLDPAEVVTAWIAFTPSTIESGCVKVQPGTHKSKQVEHVDTFDPDNLLTRGQAIAPPEDASQVVNLVLSPGEMSLHHVGLAHGSDANTTGAPRIGLAIRYMSSRVKKIGDRESAMLVRGTDTNQHFIPEQRLRGDFAITDRIAHNRALRLQVGNNYRVVGKPSVEQRIKLILKKKISQSVLDASYLGLKLKSELSRSNSQTL